METSIIKKIPIKDYRLVRATCLRCGYNWQPVIEQKPKRCPYCQSYKWNEPKPPQKKSNQ